MSTRAFILSLCGMALIGIGLCIGLELAYGWRVKQETAIARFTDLQRVANALRTERDTWQVKHATLHTDVTARDRYMSHLRQALAECGR